ncbi:hypothetical protein [Rhodococcus sp. 5G237]
MSRQKPDNAIRGAVFAIGLTLLVLIGVILMGVLWEALDPSLWWLVILPAIGFFGGLLFGGDL